MLKKVLLLLAFTFPLFASAENVPLGKAKEIADIVLNQGVPTRASTHATLVSDDGLYIFKGASGGFVIVSSDDVVEPILGYSTTGDFDLNNAPDNFKWWLSELKRGIKHLKENNVPQSERVRSLWLSPTIPTKAGTKGGRLLETANWGQQSPFNKMSPTINGKSSVAGCVPIAMAIFMRYYKWPQRGKGKLESYSFSGGSVAGYELGHEYHWDKMPMTLNESSDSEQINEVARLIYDCGVMTKTNYGIYSTTASDYTAFTKMIEHMDYDASAEYVYGAGYSRDSWVEKICSNIDNVGPVFYTSYEGKDVIGAGHSFILDGYDENGNIHINWGSGLPGNGGYFAFPDFGNFSRWHIAVFNLQPNINGKPVDVITLTEYNGQKGLSLSIKPSEIEPFKSFTVTASMILNTGSPIRRSFCDRNSKSQWRVERDNWPTRFD